MENLVKELKSSYSGKRILVTGHNGFKGSWLVALLNFLGAEVHGVSLEIEQNSAFKNFHDQPTHQSIVQDIREFGALDKIIKNIHPDLVFHLAAQALVLESYQKPRETFEVNVQGTANLLESVVSTECKGVVVATTDKVYRNDNSGVAFKEHAELWGHDPYSLSKTGSELVVAAWRSLPPTGKCVLVTVRAGNVFGPGDRAASRLLPDLVKGFKENSTIELRNPDSIRPWQFVLDPLIGYLITGSRILNSKSVSSSYNFGPNDNLFISVREIAKLFGEIEPVSISYSHTEDFLESKVLKLDSALAHKELGWRSVIDLQKGLELLIHFEKESITASNMKSLIEEFFLATSQ